MLTRMKGGIEELMQLPSTLKDQGNYGDEIQTGMYILIALNELQAVLFCRIATQYPLVGQRC